MNNNGQKTANQHMIRFKFFSLKSWTDAFLRDCRVRDLSPFTVEYYRSQLAHFEKFCQQNQAGEVEQITADLIRGKITAARHNPVGFLSEMGEICPTGWTFFGA